MSDNDVDVNHWFRELVPEILEAWVLTAPTNPDKQVYVAIPIPKALFEEIPTSSLTPVLENLFFVERAMFVVSGSAWLNGLPGLEVLCVSWANIQKTLRAHVQ